MIKQKEKVKDLSGKTSLTELLRLLRSAKLLVSNDSGVVHAAASVNTSAIVILNGSQFGRFLPYPGESKVNITPIYPQDIVNNLSNRSYLYKGYKYRSFLEINSISPEEVEKEIDNIFG